MLEPEQKTMGCIAYEAYCHSRDWKSFNEERLPEWLDVIPEIKVAWEYAATTIVQEWLGNKYATQARIQQEDDSL